MPPKKSRMNRKVFKNLSRGKTFQGDFLSLRIAKTKDNTKTTFIASKKVAKSAVARNRLRRRGYAALTNFIKKIPEGNLLAFYFKTGAEKISYQETSREVKGLLIRARLM